MHIRNGVVMYHMYLRGWVAAAKSLLAKANQSYFSRQSRSCISASLNTQTCMRLCMQNTCVTILTQCLTLSCHYTGWTSAAVPCAFYIMLVTGLLAV